MNWQRVSKEEGGYEHYLPILEPRPAKTSLSLRSVLLFSSGFFAGVAAIVLFYLALVLERAAEASQSPQVDAPRLEAVF